MNEVYVVGVGMTRFGKFPSESLRTLGRKATLRALSDAGVAPSAIELIACGSARSGMMHGQESGVGQMIGWEVGISAVPVYNVKAYCASGSTAFNVAYMALAGGFQDVALAIGVERMSGRPERGQPITSDGIGVESDFGFTPPAYFAASARRYMEDYGATRPELASVAVKNRMAAVHNPIAQYRDPITLEDVLNARTVADPLTLLDCCPTGDGAAAIVLMTADAVKRYGVQDRAVRVAASVLGTGTYDEMKDITTFPLDVLTSAKAYTQSGFGPEDIDLAEVHDAFSITEIIHIEDLGFCERGTAARSVAAGEFGLGGRLPVSTSGGLLTKGHPLGATGTAQIVEITQQLRGESGNRQVEGARVGLAQLSGGFMENDLATSSIIILEGAGA